MGRTTSPSSQTLTAPRSSRSPMSAVSRVLTATSTRSLPPSCRASKPWRWTCGSPTSTPSRAHLADAEEKLVFDRSTSSATLARRLTRSASRRTARSPPTATRAEPSRFEVPVAVLRGEPPRETPRTFRRSTRCGSEPVRAWAIKEDLRHFWQYRDKQPGSKHWKHWYFWPGSFINGRAPGWPGRGNVRLSRENAGYYSSQPDLRRITHMVQREGLVDQLSVTADGTGVVGHAGSVLVAGVADRVGLTRALWAAMAPSRERRSAHDPGVVLRDLAVMLADGGDCLADLGACREQPDLYGNVASGSTAFRVIASIEA